MKNQSFFPAVRAKKLARTAPEMLCHTENTAPGMVASGYFGKGSTGYAQYMTAFNRNFGGSSGGGGGGNHNNGGGGDGSDCGCLIAIAVVVVLVLIAMGS